jgi:hypothetical protein
MKASNRTARVVRFLTILCGLCAGLLTGTAPAQTSPAAPWGSLFNGKDLTGWTIKAPATTVNGG